MAIVEFINRPNRTYAGMRKVIDYVINPNKTEPHLISGIGVNPQNAYNEMCTLKKLMRKTDKRLFTHFVQSFAPYDNVTPELAQKVASETLEYFKDQYQILYATHTDKGHIHTHFVLNTVNVETGRKYTQNNAQRLEIQDLSDKVCEKYGLHTLSDGQKNNRKYKKPGQYRAESKGNSWKAQLKNTIDDVLSTATSKEDFISKMEQAGYQVKWINTRKNITFTTPTGMKCRDKRFGEPEYYNKHNFELIFEQNSQLTDNTEEKEMPTNTIIQGLFGLTDLLEDNKYISVTDGFMLQDADFEGMSWTEIERTIARLRHEAETRALRAMANQTEQEKKAEKQTFMQYLAMLDDFENWLYERKFGQQQQQQQQGDNCQDEDYDVDEDDWER